MVLGCAGPLTRSVDKGIWKLSDLFLYFFVEVLFDFDFIFLNKSEIMEGVVGD